MDSTIFSSDKDVVVNKSFIFYFSMSILAFGCFVEVILVIFFCKKVFLSSKNSDLKSAYFLINVIGYIVDIISSGSSTIMEIFDPDYITIYSAIAKFTVLYSDMHLGLLSALMGFNRCTALTFPFAHRKVRTISLNNNFDY